jgi:hypothetical protein
VARGGLWTSPLGGKRGLVLVVVFLTALFLLVAVRRM